MDRVSDIKVVGTSTSTEAFGDILIVEAAHAAFQSTSKLINQHYPLLRSVVVDNTTQAIEKLHCCWYRIFIDSSESDSALIHLLIEIERIGMAQRCCIVDMDDKRGYVEHARALGINNFISRLWSTSLIQERMDHVFGSNAKIYNPGSLQSANEVRLTKRQLELLQLMAEGMSAKQMAHKMGIAEGTIHNQTGVVLRKLEARSRTHAVARGIHLHLVEQSDQSSVTRQ